MSPNPTKHVGRILTILRDGNDNWSNVDFESFKVDWTPPSDPGYVYDGTAADIDTTYVLTELSANWGASADAESGVTEYRYAIGTSPGATDVLPMTSNGNSTSVTHTGLSLTHNQLYYFTIEAENAAGLTSNTMISDGQLVIDPLVGLDDLSANHSVKIFPNPATDLVTIQFEEEKPRTIEIRSVEGKRLFEQSGIGKTYRIPTSDLSPGLYFVRISSLDKPAYNLKLLKR